MALSMASVALCGTATAQPLPPPFTAGASAMTAAPPLLPAPIAQALTDSGLPVSAVSLWVQAVDEDRPRLALQGDTPRQMASVMKLLTTGVALRTLGPAYRWHTATALGGRLDANGVLRGDVHIKASGDPSLDSMRLAQALRGWRDAGLREIRGDVVVDRGLFALPAYDAAAFDKQPLKPYNAGPDAWLLAHGAVSLVLRPDPARSGQVRATLSPALADVRIDARVTLDAQAPCGDWREALQLDIDAVAGADQRRTVRLRGRYPAACQDQVWPLRWPAATDVEHSARVFEAAWFEAGGSLRGQVRDGPWPAQPTPWIEWVSPPLAEVVRDINKFSNNVMARQLFLTLGLDTEAGHATLETARTRLTEQVRQATRGSAAAGPCEGAALQLDNGSGLSRQETASAHCMARWVQVMWRDPLMPEWLASLPVAGVDGTARRMGAAVGQAHLKTGSLDGVASIAGVVQDQRGQRWVVVAVVNDVRANVARSLLQATVAWAAGTGSP